jgi:type II secretory pathway component PulF
MAKTPSQTAFIGPRIEPLLMVLLGFDVGGLILAMYLPIFAMGDLFHS